MSKNESDSSDLSDSDNDFEDMSQFTNDRFKVYQVQFVKDEQYKFTLVGFFKDLPSVELTKFDHEEYYCNISSNFTTVEESNKEGLCLYDMITMNVLKKDGKTFKLILAVEIENPNINTENKGNLMIWFEYKGKRAPLKTGLSHPGNEKLPYYIINELKNDKINKLLEEIESS
jgi:hypothetical protein